MVNLIFSSCCFLDIALTKILMSFFFFFFSSVLLCCSWNMLMLAAGLGPGRGLPHLPPLCPPAGARGPPAPPAPGPPPGPPPPPPPRPRLPRGPPGSGRAGRGRAAAGAGGQEVTAGVIGRSASGTLTKLYCTVLYCTIAKHWPMQSPQLGCSNFLYQRVKAPTWSNWYWMFCSILRSPVHHLSGHCTVDTNIPAQLHRTNTVPAHGTQAKCVQNGCITSSIQYQIYDFKRTILFTNFWVSYWNILMASVIFYLKFSSD